jgi:hypothetical protein
MTPEQFEKRLRFLEKRVCCLADTLAQETCTTLVRYDVTMTGNVSFTMSVDDTWGPFLAQTSGSGNHSVADIQMIDGNVVTVTVQANSSLFDYSLNVTASIDGVLFNQSDTNTQGDAVQFPFTVDCNQTYTITATLVQHS